MGNESKPLSIYRYIQATFKRDGHIWQSRLIYHDVKKNGAPTRILIKRADSDIWQLKDEMPFLRGKDLIMLINKFIDSAVALNAKLERGIEDGNTTYLKFGA